MLNSLGLWHQNLCDMLLVLLQYDRRKVLSREEVVCNVDAYWNSRTGHCGLGLIFSGLNASGPYPLCDSRKKLVLQLCILLRLTLLNLWWYCPILSPWSTFWRMEYLVQHCFGLFLISISLALLLISPRLSNGETDSVAKSVLSLVNSLPFSNKVSKWVISHDGSAKLDFSWVWSLFFSLI